MTAPAATSPWPRAVLAGAAEPPWLGRSREAALERFHDRGFPTRRDENWQHTDLGAIPSTDYRPAPRPDDAVLDRAAHVLGRLDLPLESIGRIVFVNGHLAASLSQLTDLPTGFEVETTADAAASLADRLGQLEGEGDAFTALNTALWEDGVTVRMRAREPHPPLHVVFLVVDSGPHPVAIQPRLVLVAEEGARASLLTTWAGEGDIPALVNATTEAWIEEGSRVEMLEVQAEPAAVDHVGHFFIRQARGSQLAACTLSHGARLARHEMLVDLGAEDVSCRIDGVAIASGRRHVDFVTRVDHHRPRGTSRQLFKGILDDRATSAFSGLVQVYPHAIKTDAKQSNHNMLLSPDAVADSKPQLEIYADDVKCAHGATVGQLDDTAVFYLRSRGLDPAEARTLLVKAFAVEVADRIEEPVLRRYARARLDAVL